MANQLMSGFWRLMLSVPPFMWEAQIAKARRKIQGGMGFMSPDHRAVHQFAVRELPRSGHPLPTDAVAAGVNLPEDTVKRLRGAYFTADQTVYLTRIIQSVLFGFNPGDA